MIMNVPNSELKKIAHSIESTLKKYHPSSVGVFGSFARGTANKNSDLDILVSFKKPVGLIVLSGLKIELEEKLGKEVDLLTPNALHPRLREQILAEQVTIYEKKR